ncbi:hypothetical protein V6N12_037024 [Hibiscus sabdariffa]|uniref:protein-serine/threonine phosphatase n=1 Tax=Hibiscus sabdariffa TaxID=183260 RepID=A0ABR2AYL7_9ROSI
MNSSHHMGYLSSVLQSSSQVHEGRLACGGGLSQNGKFSYGYASSPGKRSSMEDFYETRIDGVNGEIVGLFGVFDGHGGVRAAEYVKRHLFSNLIKHPKFISDTKSAIADAYNHTDSEFLKSENNQIRDAGSTASTAILVGDRLLVANVGDSRAVICRGGNAIAVSRDHKPDQSDERKRIENAGGFVMWAGTWRVGGVLAVSRAFGDRQLKQYVVADPEIQEEKVDSSLEFLILASDGLWDVVSNEEAVAIVKPIQDPAQAAKQLTQEASQRGSADNITCVVVRFLVKQGGSSRNPSANQGVSVIQGSSPCSVSAIQGGSPRSPHNVTANLGSSHSPRNVSANLVSSPRSPRNVSANLAGSPLSPRSVSANLVSSRNVNANLGGSPLNVSASRVGSSHNVSANQVGSPRNVSANQGGSSGNVSA